MQTRHTYFYKIKYTKIDPFLFVFLGQLDWNGMLKKPQNLFKLYITNF